MLKGFKIRIFPTKEQEILIQNHINACRFIWNYMLEKQIESRETGGKVLSSFDMNYLLKPMKEKDEYKWLNSVSNTSLCRTCSDLHASYKSFLDRYNSYPRFRSKKKAKKSYPVRCDAGYLYFSDGTVNISKIGKIKYKTDFELQDGRDKRYKNAYISYNNGKYMLSFCMECENQAHILSSKTIGIDLGIKDLAVVACGDQRIVFHNINKSKRVRELKKKLKHTQRAVSRKYEASRKRYGSYEKTKNIEREEEKLSRMYSRLANIRLNYIHQTTSALISMLPQRITMEDLNVKGMMKNRHLSRAIAEQCFYEFIRQMKYKCEWNGIEFVQADRFFPSSKTCSCCGAIKKDLKLEDRTFICHECGFVIDRDYNAAINLMRYADLPEQAAV